MKIILYCFLVHISICTIHANTDGSEQRFYNRLPKNIEPKFYDLKLWMPDIPNNFIYRGRVIIDFHVISKSNSITLNIDGLIIQKNETKVLINNSHKNNMVIISQNLDTEKQFFVISLNEELNAGYYTLHLHFTGEIRNDLFGFYRSKSKFGNETRWSAFTQFSPTFARRAFPCFDEPYLKAQFKLRIAHYDHFKVTSNTLPEQIDQTTTKNYIITTMKTTPKMSTYIFGWAVHDFEYLHLSNLSTFGIWSRKTMKEKGLITLQKGWPIYNALESWLNVKNPNEKMEQIAVTNFHFRGMENWGMIAFRESAVLHDCNVTTTKSIHDGLEVMGHEYAHSWFGNLITPEFWNFNWLKEGFATYFSYFSRSLVNPEQKIMDIFVVENVQDAFQLDAVDHNRTMNGKGPGEPLGIMGYLDFVAYKKGAAIVRMIEQIMGEKSFQAALRSYLIEKSYSFVTPVILYDYLRKHTTIKQSGSRIDIGEIIETYANQPGYPLITITRNYSDYSIQISQEHFYQHSNWTTEFNAQRWWIPLNFVSSSQRNSNVSVFGSTWLKPDEKKIAIKTHIDPQEWIICDIDKAGYYRVNYDDGNWNMLISHLGSNGFNTIRPLGRATLIDDAFNLARGGYVHYSIAFRVANYLTQETEYEPWYAAVESFDFLKQIFQDLPALQDSLKNYINSILKPVYDTLSFDQVNDIQFRHKLLRNLIFSTACKFKNHHCLKTSKLMFESWIQNSSYYIEPDLKSFVYCVGIQSGNAEVWKKVFSKFIQADLHDEKELLIKALGCTDNKDLVNQLLDFGIFNNSPDLPEQYRAIIFSKILNGHHQNIHYILDYLSKNIKKIVNARGQSFFDRLFDAMKTKITSTENLAKFSNFVEENANYFKNSEAAKSVITYATKSIYWIEKYSSIIASLLN